MVRRVSALLALAFSLPVALAVDNGLALNPQMGWNTWNHFGCDINEDIIVNAAKALISNNLTKLGYEYVVIDDCWHAPARDPDTHAPVADSGRFPRGIKPVADAIHDLGLKIGIYSSAGTFTCGGRFGSLGFEEIDAKTYAEWGIDYLKYDNCWNEGQAGTPKLSYDRYAKMASALNATGRPILYSMCNWGEDGPWNFAGNIANSWRISGDIMDAYDRYDDRCPCTDMLDCKLPGYHCAMARIIDFAAPLGQKAGKGHWNDLDMITVGNGGMTYDEYVTHFTMWAVLKSPLILGNDLTNMSEETFSIISNEAVIGVSQNNQGPASRVWKKPIAEGGDMQLWFGYGANGSATVALMNTSPNAQTIDLTMNDVFLEWGSWAQAATWTFYDLWQKNDDGKWGKDVGTFTGSMNVNIGSHQTKVWTVIQAQSASKKATGEL